jgi:hypothetical protein
VTAPARARALHTRAGRNEFFGRALAHPIRTILIVYAATRLLAVLAMWVAATWFQTPAGVGHLDPGVGDILRLWDAQWYRRIAVDGYPLPLPRDGDTGEITYSAWAFFPLFPMIVRGLMALGLDFTVAAVALNLVLGAVGAVLIWAISRKAVHAAPQAHRDRLALLATCLWCLYPATGILVMPYSEPLALVLTAATILLVMDRRYWWAAAVVIPLGFTRAVAPAVGIVVLVHLVARMGGDLRRLRTEFRGQWAGLITLCMAVAVSAVSWPVVVGLRTGRATAFYEVQAVWGQRPEKGPFVQWLTWAWGLHGVFGIALVAGCLGAYVVLVAGRHGRWLPLEVRAWAYAYPLYLFAVVRPITSMWRFLVLDFPLTALVASVAMRTSTGGPIVGHWRRRVLMLALPLVVGMFWWTATLLTYVPWGASPP